MPLVEAHLSILYFHSFSISLYLLLLLFRFYSLPFHGFIIESILISQRLSKLQDSEDLPSVLYLKPALHFNSSTVLPILSIDLSIWASIRQLYIKDS